MNSDNKKRGNGKTIFLILTLSSFTSFLVVTIHTLREATNNVPSCA